MLTRFCAVLVLISVISLQFAIGQVNAPIIRTQVIQGGSIDDIQLFSTENIRTIDAFAENMSGEGFNRDIDNSGFFNLRYQADPDFEGVDIAIFETQESLFGPPSFVTIEIEVVRSIIEAYDDFISSNPAESIRIDVMDNDASSTGSMSIIGIDATFGGQFEIIGQTEISFTPDSAFRGIANATYIVVDDLGTTSSAHLFVKVGDDSIESENVVFVHVVHEPLLILLDSDGFELAPDAELLFGQLNQVSSFAYQYQANLFTEGIESFSLINNDGDTKEIEISLIKTIDNNSTLIDDNAYTVPGEVVVIDSEANDYRTNGVIIDHSDELLYVSGVFIYEPDESFQGVKEFFYTVDDLSLIHI